MKLCLHLLHVVAHPTLKGGASKDGKFQPAKPGNFDGAHDRKVVDVWLAEMEDYLHAAKVGRHSVVELA